MDMGNHGGTHAPRRFPDADSELMRLTSSLCDGTATEADCRRLESLLADPDAMATYLAVMEQHATFLWRQRWRRTESLPTREDDGFTTGSRTAAQTPARGKRSGRTNDGGRRAAMVALDVAQVWLRWLRKPEAVALLVASVVLTGVLGVAAITTLENLSADTASNHPAGQLPVATVTGLHDVAWSANATAHSRMAGLAAGDMIEVERGLVELSYDSGALVVIEGPARYQVRGKAAGRLTSGRVTAKTVHPKASPGTEPEPLFTILTPSGVIHDLGTEFGTEVARSSGLAAVHVFEGLVELAAADRATTPDARFVRLAAGEAARMDESGKIVPASASLRRRFVRSLPQPNDDHDRVASSVWERIGWNDATAVTIYRDSFRGAGPLAGTIPASRGGIGNDAWTAPAQGWNLTADGLSVKSGMACAWLPFATQPGKLYRLTVDVHATSGGNNWLAAGLVAAPRVDQPLWMIGGDSLWFLQRHEVSSAAPNEVLTGHERRTRVDRAVGRVTRSLVLDTRSPAKVHFFLGEQLLSSQPLAQAPSAANLTLSSYDCTGSIRELRLETSTPEHDDTPTVSAPRRLGKP